MTTQVNILAIETATSSCSVALSVNDNVYECSEVGNNIHSSKLLNMVQQVLQDAKLELTDIDAVAVGQGPGSFTGLRIGVGVAQGIAYGIGCPMIGVSSLAALAHQINDNGVVVSAIDARMNEVYWGLYRNSTSVIDGVSTLNTQLIGELSLDAPALITTQCLRVAAAGIDMDNESVYLVGNAWSVYTEQFDNTLIESSILFEACVYPMASGILGLAQQAYHRKELISPIDFAPEYIRNNVAAVKKGT